LFSGPQIPPGWVEFMGLLFCEEHKVGLTVNGDQITWKKGEDGLWIAMSDPKKGK
jgi:hypothetical protein